MVTQRINIIGVGGIPQVLKGDDLPELFVRAALEQGDPFEEEDVLVVAQKVVSKAEGRLVSLHEIEPSDRAISFAAESGKDPRMVELVLRESRAVIREDPVRGILITETSHGHVCANSGIDTSNVPGRDVALLLPEDPDASAMAIAGRVRALAGIERLAVVIADTFGRPWRTGHANVAIGIAGLRPLIDYRGTEDVFGRVMRVTEMATADEVAGAAELVMGKAKGVPLAIVRGLAGELVGPPDDPMGVRPLLRDRESDLFR